MFKTQSPNYARWYNMIRRCSNPDDPAYVYYGGRGIRVCDRWLIFENFDFDMGPPPSPEHSIERREGNGNYEPNNCHWATPQEQARNRRSNVLYEHNGQKQFLDDLAQEHGVLTNTVIDRIKRKGMSVSDALTSPKMWEPVYVEIDGQRVKRSVAIREAGISLPTFNKRLKQGLSAEEALKLPVTGGRPRKLLR